MHINVYDSYELCAENSAALQPLQELMVTFVVTFLYLIKPKVLSVLLDCTAFNSFTTWSWMFLCTTGTSCPKFKWLVRSDWSKPNIMLLSHTDHCPALHTLPAVPMVVAITTTLTQWWGVWTELSQLTSTFQAVLPMQRHWCMPFSSLGRGSGGHAPSKCGIESDSVTFWFL